MRVSRCSKLEKVPGSSKSNSLTCNDCYQLLTSLPAPGSSTLQSLFAFWPDRILLIHAAEQFFLLNCCMISRSSSTTRLDSEILTNSRRKFPSFVCELGRLRKREPSTSYLHTAEAAWNLFPSNIYIRRSLPELNRSLPIRQRC